MITPPLLSLLFDVLLAVLLLATIGYCARLSKRIHLLQDSNGELAGMIAHFDQATQRATHSLHELQTVSRQVAETLQLKLDKANFLADDLAFMIEKGTKLLAQLEQARAKSAAPISAKNTAYTGASEEGVPTDALEAVLQRLASGDKTTTASTQPRTNAERELIQALKSGR